MDTKALTPPLPQFVAVATSVDDPAQLTALTPRIMRWAEGVWILDLSASCSYWQAHAQRLQRQTLALVREVLERTLATPQQPLRASLADHPWPAILVLDVMSERHLSGFLEVNTPFAQTLYRDVVWDGWFEAAAIGATHLEVCKTLPFHAPNFQRQCRQFLAAARRLRLTSPWELRHAATLSVRRRFGPTLAGLWDWTFPPPPTPQSKAAALATFPWRRWEWVDKPKATRLLDAPLWQWEALMPLLREDLDKLCRIRRTARAFAGKVTELSWKLTLHDLSELLVPVRFRHPHDLARELGHHKTALLQAQYAFEAAVKGQQRLDDHDIEVPIISWELVMEACLSTPPVIADLFGASDESSEAGRLLALENKLPIPLLQYGLCQDWLPENSYIDDACRIAEKPATKTKESWASARAHPYQEAFERVQPPTSTAPEAGNFWHTAHTSLNTTAAKNTAALSLVPPGSGLAVAGLASDAADVHRSAMDPKGESDHTPMKACSTPQERQAARTPALGGWGAFGPISCLADGRQLTTTDFVRKHPTPLEPVDQSVQACNDERDHLWLTAAQHRPLFIYPQPEPLDTGGHSSGRVFIERTSTKWWRSASDQAEHRDYYRLIDRHQRLSWVFQNESGQWFVHGVFS